MVETKEITWRRWRPGPAAVADAEVVVSMTDYTPYRWGDLPRIFWDATMLARGWPSMPGAVGVWLWSKPMQRRSGSVSVWRSPEDLREFVGSPLHVVIMRRNRGRGFLRSTTWTGPSMPVSVLWRRAADWLAEAERPGDRVTGGAHHG
ncbi:hypothetical protein [Pseudonocardia spinosispora]|uniref:hypothetical protein n=1 Tax=Pseudonocardia spinosispora TaxID=103441 RepID=UPI000421C2DC|nr:hypothetical protein [Pseudonocardia spinosispora]